MSLVGCPLCGSVACKEIAPYRGKSSCFLNKTIIQCGQCRGLSMTPFPSDKELEDYYSGYWERHDVDEEMPLQRSQAAARYEFVQSYFPAGPDLSVIDVGAGFGLIHEVMTLNLSGRRLYYDAVEVDPMAVEYLNRGGRTAKPDHIFESMDHCKGPYQIMILSHILEHMKDPVVFLENQQARLSEDGILFIEVPNQDQLYKPLNEPHLIFFEPRTLSEIVERSGYKILNVNTCGLSLKNLVQMNRLAVFKNLVRKVLPRPLFKTIRKIKKGGPFDALVRHVSDYGPDRQWIRLVAGKAA